MISSLFYIIKSFARSVLIRQATLRLTIVMISGCMSSGEESVYYFVYFIFFKVFCVGKNNNLSYQPNCNYLYSKDDQ